MSALRVGVDAVSVARIERALQHGLGRRLCRGPADADGAGAVPGGSGCPASGQAAVACAAVCWSVREAVIKIAGGRPDGFDWRDILVRHRHPAECRYAWPAEETEGIAWWAAANGIVRSVAVGRHGEREQGAHDEAVR